MPADQRFSRPPGSKKLATADLQNMLGTSTPGAVIQAPEDFQVGATQEDMAPNIEDVANALGGRVTDGTVEAQQEDHEEVEVPVPLVDGKPVDKEDQREYIRTLLSGDPFSKRYDLFGGQVSITFKTRTNGENDQVDIDMRSSALKSVVAAKTPAIVRERLRMVTSTDSLVIGADRQDVSVEFFDGMNEPTFAAIRKAYRNFEEICDVMFEMANNSDFWNGTDGTI